MSPKQWLALLTFYLSYLFFGATVFYYLEQELETERRAVALMERIEINGEFLYSGQNKQSYYILRDLM
jgi:hypothetical protein